MSKVTRNINMKAEAAANLPFNSDRQYLMLVGGTNLTVQLGAGTAFSVPDGEVWEPYITPMNAITFTGTGVMVTG